MSGPFLRFSIRKLISGFGAMLVVPVLGLFTTQLVSAMTAAVQQRGAATMGGVSQAATEMGGAAGRLTREFIAQVRAA